MEGRRYSVSFRTPARAPQEAREYAREAARRQAGNEIYGVLLSNRLPAVVDIEETTREVFLDYTIVPDNEFRIDVIVNPVQHRHFEMPSSFPSYTGIVDESKIERLKTELAYMALGVLCLFTIIVWFVFAN